MPTVRGWCVALLSAAALIGAWRLRYPELAVLGVAGAAALLVGAAVVLRPVPLRVSREVAPTQVARGEPALSLVVVGNTGRWATPPLIAVDVCGRQRITVAIPPLRRGTSQPVTYALPTTGRGELTVGPLELSAADPFGLFRRTRRFGAVATLLVHPRVVPLAVAPSGRLASVDGPASATAPSGTSTFHALREYAFGDDLRHISWRASARTGTLMVRQLIDVSLPHTVVLLDNRATQYPDDVAFERAVDVAATVTTAAVRAGFPATLGTVDGGCLPVHGDRLLRQLALVDRCPTGSLAEGLNATRAGRSGGALVLVTGFGPVAVLDQVAAAKLPMDRVVVVRTAAAQAPVERGAATVLDVHDLADFAAQWHRRVRP